MCYCGALDTTVLHLFILHKLMGSCDISGLATVCCVSSWRVVPRAVRWLCRENCEVREPSRWNLLTVWWSTVETQSTTMLIRLSDTYCSDKVSRDPINDCWYGCQTRTAQTRWVRYSINDYVDSVRHVLLRQGESETQSWTMLIRLSDTYCSDKVSQRPNHGLLIRLSDTYCSDKVSRDPINDCWYGCQTRTAQTRWVRYSINDYVDSVRHVLLRQGESETQSTTMLIVSDTYCSDKVSQRLNQRLWWYSCQTRTAQTRWVRDSINDYVDSVRHLLLRQGEPETQ